MLKETFRSYRFYYDVVSGKAYVVFITESTFN